MSTNEVCVYKSNGAKGLWYLIKPDGQAAMVPGQSKVGFTVDKEKYKIISIEEAGALKAKLRAGAEKKEKPKINPQNVNCDNVSTKLTLKSIRELGDKYNLAISMGAATAYRLTGLSMDEIDAKIAAIRQKYPTANYLEYNSKYNTFDVSMRKPKSVKEVAKDLSALQL